MTVAELVVWGLLIAVLPFGLVAFIIVVSAERGSRNGAAFILGWLLSLTLVATAAALLSSATSFPTSTSGGKWSYIIQILLGLVLIVVWWRRHSLPDVPEPVESKWFSKLKGLRPRAAFVAGVLTPPWPIVGAAFFAIARSEWAGWQRLLGAVALGLLGTSALFILELVLVRDPEQAAARLNGLMDFIARHRGRVLTVAALVVGLYMIGEGALGLLALS